MAPPTTWNSAEPSIASTSSTANSRPRRRAGKFSLMIAVYRGSVTAPVAEAGISHSTCQVSEDAPAAAKKPAAASTSAAAATRLRRTGRRAR